MSDYTLDNVREDVAEIKRVLAVQDTRHELMISMLREQQKKTDEAIQTVVSDMSALKTDISKWKGALGLAGFVLTIMGGLLGTAVHKAFGAIWH